LKFVTQVQVTCEVLSCTWVGAESDVTTNISITNNIKSLMTVVKLHNGYTLHMENYYNSPLFGIGTKTKRSECGRNPWTKDKKCTM